MGIYRKGIRFYVQGSAPGLRGWRNRGPIQNAHRCMIQGSIDAYGKGLLGRPIFRGVPHVLSIAVYCSPVWNCQASSRIPVPTPPGPIVSCAQPRLRQEVVQAAAQRPAARAAGASSATHWRYIKHRCEARCSCPLQSYYASVLRSRSNAKFEVPFLLLAASYCC